MRKLTQRMVKLAIIEDLVHVPCDEDEGVSCRVGFAWHEYVDSVKKALEALDSWKLDRDHVLEACSYEESADIEVR